MERVSHIKCKSPVPVFNLHVSGHPSYFADGILVHNCHNQGGPVFSKIMADHVEAGAACVGYTATPLDLEGWEELLIAGTMSECLKIGALVKPETYAPDEPDLKHIKKYVVGQELTEAENTKAIMRPGVFGRVLKAWKQHNPDGKPTLLFGPDVAGSLFFAQEFCKAGIKAAHIDGEQIWCDGTFYNTEQDAREWLAEQSRTGEIKVVCNRFVLREGIDWPWIQVGSFATVFGALTSFLQSGGRLLRAHPGKEKCIAEGSLVLTKRGLVPIEKVLYNDRLWDGQHWVKHHGVICHGTQKVITYCGLTGTPDHVVYTRYGRRTLGECARLRLPLAATGMGGQEIRNGCRYISDNASEAAPRAEGGPQGICRGDLREVPPTGLGVVGQFGGRKDDWVPPMQSAAEVPEMALSSPYGSLGEMHQQEPTEVERLRRKGNRIPISIGIGCVPMGNGQSWLATQSATQPYRQQRSLRAGQYSLVNGNAEFIPRPRNEASCEDSSVPNSAPGRSLRGQHASLPSGNDEPGTGGETVDDAVVQTERRVWDILNAGPLHRFTVSGVLVANCTILDHGGNWHRHGSLAVDRHWQLGMTNQRVTADRQEKLREKKEQEPITCPECGKVRGSGAVCPACGFEAHRRARVVVQIDGTLREVKGDIYRPRVTKLQPNTQSLWDRIYWRARSQKWNASFRQAEAMFFRENYYWPPRNLTMMPKDPNDWYKKVAQVPKEALNQ